MDCNLKKLANFFKFVQCVLENLLNIDYGLFFLQEFTLYLVFGALRTDFVFEIRCSVLILAQSETKTYKPP